MSDMSTLAQGDLVVIPNLQHMWPDYDAPNEQLARTNAMGIVADGPNEDECYVVKYVRSDGQTRDCVRLPGEEVFFLAHGADSTQDIAEELMRLLPEVIANLASEELKELLPGIIANLAAVSRSTSAA